MPPPPGLSASLSKIVVAHTIEYDNAFEEYMPHRTSLLGLGGPPPPLVKGRPISPPWLVSRTMWSNVLRYVGRDGVRVDSLVSRPGELGGLLRWGYLTLGPGGPAKPSGDAVVRLTRGGHVAAAIFRRLDAAIDDRWRVRFGADALGRVDVAAREVLGEREIGLPRFLPVVGFADGMRLHADAVASDPARLGIAEVLARVLMLITLDVEAAGSLSLVLVADVLPALDTEPIPMREAGLRSGISAEAMNSATAFLERLGLVAIVPEPGGTRGKAILLTDEGLAARARHDRSLEAVERKWGGRPGVAALRDGLAELLAQDELLREGLEPPPGSWRAAGAYRSRTAALLADPARSLPRQPVPLHRGGYPDGS